MEPPAAMGRGWTGAITVREPSQSARSTTERIEAVTAGESPREFDSASLTVKRTLADGPVRLRRLGH
jgi:hypothetical protein